jgi:hypothetical protein
VVKFFKIVFRAWFIFLSSFFSFHSLANPPNLCQNKANMLSREEFVFTIGYDGPAAMVDGQAKRRYSSLSTKELAEKGLFRAAYSSAVWSKDPKELEVLAEIYNKTTGNSVQKEALQRLFGVYPVDVARCIIL